MGGSLSKRIKIGKRRKTKILNDIQADIEAVYESIDGDYHTLGSSIYSRPSITSNDSAFSERSSRTSLPSCSHKRNTDYNLYKTYPRRCLNHADACIDDSGKSCYGDCQRKHFRPHRHSIDQAQGSGDDYYTYDECPVTLNRSALTDISGTSFQKECVDVNSQVPFMVESFQPVLEQIITVTELLPFIEFIQNSDFPPNETQSESFIRLITIIQESEEKGKWQTFISALERAEYSYIARLLKGHDVEDHYENRRLIQIFKPNIMTRIDTNDVLDHLLVRNVLNDRDREEIQSEKDRRGEIASAFMLLEKIPRRNENWFKLFLDVLKVCHMDDVVESLTVPKCSPEKKRQNFTLKQPAHKRRRNKFNSSANTYLTPISDDPPPLPYRENNYALRDLKEEDEPTLPDIIYKDPAERRTTPILTMGRNNTNSSKNASSSEKEQLDELEQQKADLERKLYEKRKKMELNAAIASLQKQLMELEIDSGNPTHNEDEGPEKDGSDFRVSKESKSNCFKDLHGDSKVKVELETIVEEEKQIYDFENEDEHGHILPEFEDNYDVAEYAYTGGKNRLIENISQLLKSLKKSIDESMNVKIEDVKAHIAKEIKTVHEQVLGLNDKYGQSETLIDTYLPVQLYSVTPTAHLLGGSKKGTRRLYSIDSAIYSDNGIYDPIDKYV
ncbi:uncharacterized protein LOC128226852 isoform X2 [Mya arenaria]|uniref:uncharacterized protein LOC128226852 isoform X2 n=1 Tax=Mya arenaria TaxID=6604 RepID=UPI0022E65511|nr:uncharacterized protein LOC128226852 isoform X2 [Mya arenaria]